MLSTHHLIKLNGEQVEKSDFPTGCPVYICSDHTPAYIQSCGEVVGVFLKMGSVLGMFCKVRNGENEEDIVPIERLRFQTDCPVYVTQGEHQLEGVILGFCKMPETNKQRLSAEDTYWYSILLCKSKRLIHEVCPDQVSFRSMTKISETSIPKEVVIREAGDISVLPSILDPPPNAVVIDLMNIKEEPIDQEMEVDQGLPTISGSENTHNDNRILSFQESDCQNAEIEVNTEFQHPDDGYSDDSDNYSSSSSIVEIPMPDMNLQIEASGEDEIVHHTEANTSDKISSFETATFDKDNEYQIDSSSRKSSTEKISCGEPAPLTQDNEDQSVNTSSKKSSTEKVSSGDTAPLILDNENQSDNSSNKRSTDNSESGSLNLNNEDQCDNNSNRISNDKTYTGEATPLTPGREETNSDCTKKQIIGEKRSIDEISNGSGTSPLLGNEAILSESTKKQNIGKKRSIEKISIGDNTIDLSRDFSESEDVQTTVNTSLPTNRDINSFKICRRVKSIGTGLSLLGSMLQEWRTCPPVQGEDRHTEFQGRTYYWCSKCKNLNGTWALHHQEDHRVDDPDYNISHWTEKAPNSSQSPSRREGEKWYNWCNECRNGKGQWTSTHKLGDHWKYVPPQPSSRLSKTKGSLTFHWCKKCRDGLGMWSMHSEQNHRGNFKKRVREEIRTYNPFHLRHMFSRFVQTDGEILSTLKSKVKTVPRSHWTSGSMCLTFHLMGYCLKECRRAEDHQELCSSDASKLYDWCLESSVEKTEVALKSKYILRTTKEKKIRNSKSRANIPPKANAPPKGKGASIQKINSGCWYQKIVLAEVEYKVLTGACTSREI